MKQLQTMVSQNNDPSIHADDYTVPVDGASSHPKSCSQTYENVVNKQVPTIPFGQLDINSNNSSDHSHNHNNRNNTSSHNNYDSDDTNTNTNNSIASTDTGQPKAGIDGQETLACRDIGKLRQLISDTNFDKSTLRDEELILSVNHKLIPAHKLEDYIRDAHRSVKLRRLYYEQKIRRDIGQGITNLPYEDFDYAKVVGACCENVIGYVQLPVAIAGPLILNGQRFFVPMATTEECLVNRTNRGFSALSKSGGVKSFVSRNLMTRAPCVKFADFEQLKFAHDWLQKRENFDRLAQAFNSTSNFAKLSEYKVIPVGQMLYIRFSATTGDAMGMNMLSKGAERALEEMKKEFPTMEVVSLSSNYCTDKKPAAVNWILGRGKSVTCEAVIPADVVQNVFKTSVEKMVDFWNNKVIIGSTLAGSIGGYNLQAADIVMALYIACGQDPAQNVTSSNCLIVIGQKSDASLYVSCRMSSIECGTVGGGTILPAQSAALQMMGISGPSKPPLQPGKNAEKFAEIVCASVLAGELSSLAALAEGTLVRSHIRHNWPSQDRRPTQSAPLTSTTNMKPHQTMVSQNNGPSFHADDYPVPVDDASIHPKSCSQAHENVVNKQVPTIPFGQLDINSNNSSNHTHNHNNRNNNISSHNYNNNANNYTDTDVKLRRLYFEQRLCREDKGSHERSDGITNLPHKNFNYDKLADTSCRDCNGRIPVIGLVQLPIGIAGPLILNGEEFFVPMATTEGCLVASTARGFSALSKSGGVQSSVGKNFMTQASCVKFIDLHEGKIACDWLNKSETKARLARAFNSTSNFAKFIDYTVKRATRQLYIRFSANTGDAMETNMLSMGAEKALEEMQKEFPNMEVVSLASNYDTDKKPAAVNWIQGRGTDVECEAVIPAKVVQTVFKVSVEKMVDLWGHKVMVGSTLAGSIGGYNCQAANIVTALYIACGQDPARNVTSSNCMIQMNQESDGSLYVSCSMPSIECGTVGGGTILPAQSAALQMMGISGPSKPPLRPGKNAEKFAEIVCASVLAGELSLLAALAEGTLVRSHMRHNRSSLNVLNAAQEHSSPSSSE